MKFWSKINVVKTLFQLANIYHLIITLLIKRQFLWARYFVYPGESGFYGVLMHEAKFCKGERIGF